MNITKLESRGDIVKQAVATLIEEESNRTSLITVTRVMFSSDARNATVYVSVFPESGEEFALNFLKRLRPEMKTRAKKALKSNLIPFIDVEIDKGEKNRQKIEDILRNE
jgi:ribosome-binding factor A